MAQEHEAKTNEKSSERWSELKREALAVVSVAGSLTVALWIKRIIERLTTSNVIDPQVLRNGLKTAPETSPSPPSQESGVPPLVNLKTTMYRQHRSGPGRVYVPGRGHILYRSAVQTSDGYTLYDHHTQLNDDHIGPCPLLHTDMDCTNCPWSFDDGPYHFDPKCAALVKLHEEPREGMSLSGVKRQLEGSL